MHETAIVESALDLIFEKAEEHHLQKINRITAKVGRLSGALPEALEFAFECLSKGTITEGAEFVIERIEATAECGPCGISFPVMHVHTVCPQCGGIDNKLLTGYELYIDTIEGD